MVLYRYVLLASKAAAHQLVFHHHLLLAHGQHGGGFVLGVVGALVRGVDQHPVPLGQGYRAFRLQEGVLRKGGMEGAPHHIAGIGDGLAGVSPVHLLMGQQVAAGMQLGGVVRHGFRRAGDGYKRLVIHLHQGLGLLEDLRGLCHHQTDGVPQVVGDLPHRHQGEPIPLQVAYLHQAGDVVGGEYPQYPG